MSFLKCKIDSNDITSTTSRNIIENFLLKTEKASKFANIKTEYNKDTI